MSGVIILRDGVSLQVSGVWMGQDIFWMRRHYHAGMLVNIIIVLSGYVWLRQV